MGTGLRAGPGEQPPAGGRRRAERPQTIPEQISDHIGLAILKGDYAAGERIREKELAELYGVSRGPIREAVRFLERRGLVEFLPHRGIYALDISPDVVADLFNVRASLLGLAARCFTRMAKGGPLAELDARVARLREAAANPGTGPTAFALDNGRAGAVLYRNCGNGQLSRMLQEQATTSLWGLLWRHYPLDFLTPQRRQEAAASWERIRAAVRAGDEAAAETLTRALLFASRDQALEVVTALRGQAVDPAKRLGARAPPRRR